MDALILVAQHLRHDAAPCMSGLYLHVGNAAGHGRPARYRHLQLVRMRLADDLPILKNANRPPQIKWGRSPSGS